jgi:hypothetical protein
MNRPIVITTPRPTPEETAKLLRIPKKDVTRLQKLVDQWAWSPETISKFGEPLNDHTSNGKRKKPATKRGPRENGHR